MAALPGAVVATDPLVDILVHEGDAHEDSSGAVCNFHLHVVTADAEDGYWEIWTEDGAERIEHGQYSAAPDTDDVIPDDGTMSLPDGDYELRWDIEPVDGSRDEKDFSVECPEAAPTPEGGVGGGSPSPTPTAEGGVGGISGSPSPTPTPEGGVGAVSGSPSPTPTPRAASAQ